MENTAFQYAISLCPFFVLVFSPQTTCYLLVITACSIVYELTALITAEPGKMLISVQC